jgi:DNA-directed RNA polymerase subunit omega
MIQVPLDKLTGQVDSKYTLVVLAAKRAREIVGENHSAPSGRAGKPVTVSLQEISSGKITYERTKAGIK